MKPFVAIIASVFLLCAVLGSCTSNPITPAFDETLLLKTWYFDWQKTAMLMDSFKKLYVAEGQPLPPARGRTGMIFERGGKYTYIGIAPADGPLYFNGSWRWITPTSLLVQHEAKTFQGASFPAEIDTLEVLSLSTKELLVWQMR
jgi:hypothetical protein